MLSVYFEEESAHQYKENKKIKDGQNYRANGDEGIVEIAIGDEEDDE